MNRFFAMGSDSRSNLTGNQAGITRKGRRAGCIQVLGNEIPEVLGIAGDLSRVNLAETDRVSSWEILSG